VAYPLQGVGTWLPFHLAGTGGATYDVRSPELRVNVSLMRMKSTDHIWFIETMKSILPEVTENTKLFDDIAVRIAEEGTIDGVAMLGMEKNPRSIGCMHSAWADQWKPVLLPPLNEVAGDASSEVRGDDSVGAG
jgi:hypothetical protein